MTLLAIIADLFWGLALVLGICFALSLLLGLLSQARYHQKRRKWARDIGGTP